ncbi:MAG: penicillin-binding protein 2 [Chloroflexota bacterium]
MNDEWEEGGDNEDGAKVDPVSRRMFLFKASSLAFAGLIGRQLWQMQVVDGARYLQSAEENRMRMSTVKPPRGVMYDRNSLLLVRNVPSYTVGVIPASLPNGKTKEVFRRLGGLLSIPAEQIETNYNERLGRTGEFTPVPIKEGISTEAAFAIEEQHLDLPGVALVVEAIREYRDGPLGAHLVGYIGRITAEQYSARKDDTRRRYDANDHLGQTGLEQIYEEELRGSPGEKIFEVDSSEREVGVLRAAQPQPGHNLVLSIDWNLQRAVTEILSKYIKDYGAASAIVMDPHNGQVLAMVDLPTYDNNLFAKGISQADLDSLLQQPYYPLINKSFESAFPPGSTFKTITAAGALQAGIVKPETIVNCPGGIFIPSQWGDGAWLKCWATHGPQDMLAGTANSCNTYFYHLAGGEPHDKWPGLGPDHLAEYARTFGLGAPTGIDLPGEVGGLVPDPKWKQEKIGEPWYRGDTYIMGIGQSFLRVTPLQMLLAATAIANGGTLYKPQVVLEIRDSEGNSVRGFQPNLIRELPIDKEHLAVVREGMRQNMLYGTTTNGAKYWGTAWDSEVPGVEMATKTGTAESVLNEKGVYDTHGWCVGFAPYKNPKVAVLVFVHNGKGPQHAAPRLAEIMRYYFNVPADKK